MLKGIALLFLLNLADAVLTLFWVRNGFATEGNLLMAKLLDMGDGPFLFGKILVGVIAATVLYRFANMRLARYGLSLALVIYIGLMVIHFITGLNAFGLITIEPSGLASLSSVAGILSV